MGWLWVRGIWGHVYAWGWQRVSRETGSRKLGFGLAWGGVAAVVS